MKTIRKLSLALLLAFPVFAQWSDFATVTGSTNLSGAMNARAFWQTGSGAPSSVACVKPGLDKYFDTASHLEYKCSVAGTPGTWTLLFSSDANYSVIAAMTNYPTAFPPVNSGDWAGTWQTHAPGFFQAALVNYSTISGLAGYPGSFPPVNSGDWAGTWQSHAPSFFQTAISGAPGTWPAFGTFALLNNPMTTGGDFLVGGSSGAPARLAFPGNGTFCPTWTSGTPSWITCPGAGGGLTSVGISPTSLSWLTFTNNPLTVNGNIGLAPSLGQTPHQVIGTCGASTSFGPCPLVAADIPSLSYSPIVAVTAGPTGQYSTLAAAVAANGSNAHIVVQSSDHETLTSVINLSGSNLTITCMQGATLTKGYNGTLFAVTGTNITIDGCQKIDGAQAGGFTGHLITASGSTNFQIRNSALINSQDVALYAVTTGTQTGLTVGPLVSFAGNLNSAFYQQGPSVNTTLLDLPSVDCSAISSTSFSCIAAHTQASAETNVGFGLSNVNIKHGAGNFGVEIGAFASGAVPPDGVKINNLTVTHASNSSGGLSLSNTTNAVVSNVHLDFGGTTSSLTEFETVGSTGIAISNVTTSNAPTNQGAVLSLNATSNSSLQGCFLQGGIYVGTSITTSLQNGNNTISNCVLQAQSASTYAHGLIWLQCNAPNCTVSGNHINGNQIMVLAGASVAYGVALENDQSGAGGVVANNDISKNSYLGTFTTAHYNTTGTGIGAVIYDVPATTGALVGDGNGTPVAATGTAGNCLHVDGSNGTCVQTTDVGTVTNTMLAGSIANGKLVNSTITIAGTSVALGGSTASLPSPGAIGGTTPSTGAFTTVSASGQVTSTVTTGTAPLVVASTTQVANLNSATAGTATNVAGGAIGGVHYQSGAGATAFLSGNTAATDQVVTSTGTGSAAQVPTLKNAPALALTNMAIGSNTVLGQKFFGTAAPGSVAGNLPGDTFSDTTNHNDYWCNAASGTAAPACTSVTAGGWTLLNGGSGIVNQTTGSGPPTQGSGCAAPTSGNLTLYFDTPGGDLYYSNAASGNCWQFWFHTTGIGPFTLSGLAGSFSQGVAASRPTCAVGVANSFYLATDTFALTDCSNVSGSYAWSSTLNSTNSACFYNSTATTWACYPPTSASSTVPMGPSGTAGGDVSGLYPSPTVIKVNGGSIPASSHLSGTNSSSQFVAATAADISAIDTIAGGGTAQAQTATYSPAIASLTDGLHLCWLPTAANTAAAPTFSPSGLTAHPTVKSAGAALVANDITTTAHACAIYNLAATDWELQNPQTSASGVSSVSGTAPVLSSGGATPAISCPTCVTSAASLTSGAIVTGAGSQASQTTALQISSNTLSDTTSTQAVVYQGGSDASANSALGAVTLRGASETGAGGASSQGGAALHVGGANAATNAASAAGSVEVIPGASTGATTGLQGLAIFAHSFAQSGTVTQWNLECYTGTAMTVTDCGASPTNIAGVALSKTSTVQVAVAVAPSEIPINASAAVTVGHTACAGTTAGQVTDSGGTGLCAVGRTVGVFLATGGVWPAFPDGTTFPTLSTTLPLIRLLDGSAGSNAFQVNGTGLTAATPINFENGTAVDGITLTFANPSLGNVQLGMSGTLTIAGGGTSANTATAGTVPNASSSSAASWTATPVLGVDNSVAGSFQTANGSASAHTTWGSAATTSNTINGFTVAPTTGDVIDASVSGSTTTLHDSGVATANVVTAASNYTSGNLVQAAASNKTTSDSGIATANVVTAASAASGAKQICTASGASKTCSYIDFPERFYVPAANCNNTTAGSGWSIGSGGTVTCRAGTNNQGGYIAVTDTSGTFAQFSIPLPFDWDSGSLPYIRFQLAYPGTDGASAHTIIPQIKVACTTATSGVSDDPTFAAAHSSSTITLASATANLFFSTSNVQTNSTDMSGCVAGGLMIVQIGRATDTATSAVNFYGATVTFPRLLVVGAQ